MKEDSNLQQRWCENLQV